MNKRPESFVRERRLFGSRLQRKITLIIIAILAPLLIAFTIIDIQAQQTAMEELLFEKARTIASSGAQTIGEFWEQTIADGELTSDQVFDTDYERFWTYDPDEYEYEFDGDPASLAKYHTAYDQYTDEHWQEIIDAYLDSEEYPTSEDIIYAVPVDKNGYLPTHNTIWSTGDHSPATDRTKRIFDDPVGIKAAQNTQGILRQVYPRPGTGETLWDISAPIYVNGEHWGAFRVGMVLTQNQARVTAAFWRIAGSMALVGFFVVLFAWWVGRYVARPIVRLTDAATRMAHGEFGQRVDIPRRDEITVLAEAFNTMASQLGDLVTSLETRVAERTDQLQRQVAQLEESSRQNQRRARQLQASAQVAHAVASTLDPDELLDQVVHLISEQFGHYHTGVFLLDETRQWAMLRAANSEGGRRMLARGHRLEVGQQGIIGYVTGSAKPRIALDVGADAVYFDNPDLPETRSEVGLPLIARGQLIGALDVQSTEPSAFDEEDIAVLSGLAEQIATALDNARLYEASRSALAQLEAVQRRYAGEVWGEQISRYETDFYEYRMGGGMQPPDDRPEELSVVDKALGQGTTAMDAGGNGQKSTLAAPIKVRGDHVIGVLGLQKEEEEAPWSPEQVALIETVAAQVAQAMEAVHLIDETQRYADRERLLAEVSDKIRSAPDMGSILRIAVQETRRILGVSHGFIRLGTETHLQPPQTDDDEAAGEGGDLDWDIGVGTGGGEDQDE